MRARSEFPIPVVAQRPYFGPGSQESGDEVLNTLDRPNDVHVFRPPVAELNAPPQVVAAAMAFLRQLLAALRATPFAAPEPLRFSLLDLAPAVRAEVNELLGEGEVSILTTGGLRAQETSFTGIWRIRGEGVDDVEAGAFPRALRQLADARPPLDGEVPTPIEGLMNAPALYNEIRDRSAQWKATSDGAAQVINLSLLPASPEDLAWLDQQLGRGGISILSRGFGNCRITAAALPRTWWVQYFNNMEKLILNSVEIVDLPSVALAAPEDYADTMVRLDEWIESLASAA